MRESALYIDGLKFPITPARLSFTVATQSTKYELISIGEAELLQGARLAEVVIEGVFPAAPGYGALDALVPQVYVDCIKSAVEDARPVHLIYIGQTWDVNMMCSVQSPEFYEVGGCFDIEYKVKLRKWVEIAARSSTKTLERKTTSPKADATGSSYTVKENDTLSHIAKSLLGDSSRWRELYELNKNAIGNPNLIYPGQTLKLPGGASEKAYSQSTAKKSYSRSASKNSANSSSRNSSKSNAINFTSSLPVSPGQGNTNASSSYLTASDFYKQYANQFKY